MSPYRFFTSQEIRPSGWLKKQLELQADGLAGNLDKIRPDVRGSARIGGRTRTAGSARTATRPSASLYYAKCGPLVFALPLKENWTRHEYSLYGVDRKYPYCDYFVATPDPWNFAFACDAAAAGTDRKNRAAKTKAEPPSVTLTRCEHEGSDIPFSTSSPRVTLKASLVPIEWGTEPGFSKLPAKIPRSASPCGEPSERELIPYGSAKLRMTELPIAR